MGLGLGLGLELVLGLGLGFGARFCRLPACVSAPGPIHHKHNLCIALVLTLILILP